MPKISKTSKMQITGKKVGSWSLPAGNSCPGAKGAEVCEGCYAKKGMYRFPVVKNVREYNKQDYHKDDWVDRMVREVNKFDYFRWFDSGDIETPELARKITKVVVLTKKVKHWIPTRSDKLNKIEGAYREAPANSLFGLHMQFNAVVRPSADFIGLNNNERPGVNSFVINNTTADLFEAKKQGIYVCPVGISPNQKSCDTCTKCYTDEKVAYVLH